MQRKTPIRIKSITEYHRILNLPKPEHPLISIVDYAEIDPLIKETSKIAVFDFYFISIKKDVNVKFKYGQQLYDFDEGMMFFMSPNQVISVESGNGGQDFSGWILLIHPDFFWNTSLANSIRHYEFFDYSVNEALFLSAKEELIVKNIINNIKQEYHSNIDKFSQQIIISQIESLLNYSNRFYNRQFITREKNNHQVLERFEKFINDYLNGGESIEKGLLTVQFVAQNLNISPNYLSALLKILTGDNAKQHIQNKILEKTKERLSTTNLTVSEIAYELGFERLQSFSKLFKSKTKLSPIEFRASFN